MPALHYPRADKREALDQIAKAVREIKAAFAGTDRERKIEEMLPELRALYKTARNGEDAPPLIRLVTRLNAKSWLTNRQFNLRRIYAQDGYVFDVEVKRY